MSNGASQVQEIWVELVSKSCSSGIKELPHIWSMQLFCDELVSILAIY